MWMRHQIGRGREGGREGERERERERDRERDPSLSSGHFALTPSHADRKKQTGERNLVEDYWLFK